MAELDYRQTYSPAQAARVLAKFPDVVKPALVSGAFAAASKMATLTIRETLEMKGPTYLNRDTGNLIRSVAASPASRETDYGAEGRYGSNAEYAELHEKGWQGSVAVRAHVRQWKGRAVNVRAHGRNVTIRSRWMFRDTAMRHRAQVMTAAADAAMDLVLETGRTPTAGEVLKRMG